jgi:hypothetical protein
MGTHQSVVVLNLLHRRLSREWALEHCILVQLLQARSTAGQQCIMLQQQQQGVLSQGLGWSVEQNTGWHIPCDLPSALRAWRCPLRTSCACTWGPECASESLAGGRQWSNAASAPSSTCSSSPTWPPWRRSPLRPCLRERSSSGVAAPPISSGCIAATATVVLRARPCHSPDHPYSLNNT